MCFSRRSNTLPVQPRPLVQPPMPARPETHDLSKERLLRHLRKLDRDVVLISPNYPEFLPHYRWAFLNVQTQRFTLEAESLPVLAELILRHKQAVKSCIYLRINDVTKEPPFFAHIMIQTGVMPERASKDGLFESCGMLIQQLYEHLQKDERLLYRNGLLDSPSNNTLSRVHLALIKNRCLPSALQETSEILSMFHKVEAFSFRWREPDDQIILVIHYQLPPERSDRKSSQHRRSIECKPLNKD